MSESVTIEAGDWGPDPPRVICEGGPALRPERWSPWRHGTWSYKVTAINADGTPVEGATVTIGPVSGNPARLCIDGREYARRRKARRRRR